MNKTKSTEISTSETTRKIGRTTYIVSSTYAEGNKQDLVAVMARLIQGNANLSTITEHAKSA